MASVWASARAGSTAANTLRHAETGGTGWRWPWGRTCDRRQGASSTPYVIFRRAAPAIHVFVEHARASGGQARDDEAGVCSSGAGLDARDDPLDPVPARGGVVEL